MITIEAVREHALTAGTAVAVSDGEKSLTWNQLADEITALRSWLTRSLDPDDRNRAVVVAGNSVRVVAVTAALTSLGVPWVGVDPARDAATIREQLESVGPTLIVFDSALPNLPADFRDRWSDSALLLDMVGFPAFDTRATHYLGAAGFTAPAASWQNPPFLTLGFTSGTTGTPKLFVRRRRTENQRVAYLRDRLGFGPGDSFLITSPLAFASGHVWVSAALALGGSVRLGPADPAQALRVLAEERLTGGFLVPPFLEELLEAAEAAPVRPDLTRLRFLLSGGRHLSPRAVRQSARLLGDVLHLYYATTETGINSMADPGDLAADPYSSGRFMPGVTVRALDPESLLPLGTGHVGQLAIDSAYAMDEYVHRPLDTVQLDGRRHILTSDFGRVDSHGRLYVTARSSGDPRAVETRLDVVRVEGEIKEHPAVLDVCVTGAEDAPEHAIAVLVLRPELAERAAEQARGHVVAVLDRYTDDSTVVEVSRIPYNSAGKVALRELRDQGLLRHRTPADLTAA
ncbi:class I adenylate-forming enzyme family protein [Streptacidiphilus sp. P02-A3a]|uniref:class I adenylate-forming enzyme family protein n=1 Tax=Streptacidiphilus sp. P02-A3a TaxID=2704468 RepID=UPI0015FAE4D9|nr:class I adenylate-forming enzyme family protein [Streptacidiphilus sp. P02-A3a]QMU71250.1 acyl--CoA ligase [Streptacidiphilus sp. P02-A3a]